MSEEEIQKVQKKQNNFNEPRDFGCPCGKTYLSYPALYTHVKSKHNGKPPGEITKPKNEKTRGRPRTIIVDTPIDDSQCQFDIKQQIQKVCQNANIDYNQIFQTSQGNSSCQDMSSKLLAELEGVQQKQLKIIRCFLNELKQLIIQKFGDKFWTENSPRQLIDIANQLFNDHSKRKQKYPLENEVLYELIFLLFKWMYRNNWTKHKMVKRGLGAHSANSK